jgi:hypothetical protein
MNSLFFFRPLKGWRGVAAWGWGVRWQARLYETEARVLAIEHNVLIGKTDFKRMRRFFL